MKKTIWVLVGPPSVGKSTWINKTFRDVKPYIINRDDIVEKVAEDEEYNWTYDDMFVKPPAKSVEGDKSEKYGLVIKAPAYMKWPGAPKLVYDKVLDANGKVAQLFNQRLAGAKGQDKIVVDMTNMNSGSRKSALKAIEGQEGEYHKVAVVFNFKGSESIIKKVAKKRAEEAKKDGKSKTIPDEVFDSMFQSYDLVSEGGGELSHVEIESRLKSEGFDEVQLEDNIEGLKKYISESTNESQRFNYLRSWNTFKVE